MIVPKVFLASKSRFKARLVRSANNKETGAANKEVAVGKAVTLVISPAIVGIVALRTNTRIVQTSSTLTVGRTARAVGEVGQDDKCRRYLKKDRT